MRGALLVAVLASPAAAEPRAFACALDDGSLFTLALDAPSPDGPVHCVEAALGGGAACAPQGGWGIAGAEGPRLTTDPAEAAGTDAFRLFARLGPSEFVASASEGPGVPLALEVGGPTFWRLRVALDTGEGVVGTRDGERAARCEAITSP